MLILTPEVADHVRGLTIPGHALAPVPLKDGTFALPEAVLDDPAHASKRDYLIANADIMLDSAIKPGTPTASYPGAPVVGSDWSEDQTLLEATTYKEAWPVGKVVAVDPVTKIATVDGVVLSEPIEVVPTPD